MEYAAIVIALLLLALCFEYKWLIPLLVVVVGVAIFLFYRKIKKKLAKKGKRSRKATQGKRRTTQTGGSKQDSGKRQRQLMQEFINSPEPNAKTYKLPKKFDYTSAAERLINEQWRDFVNAHNERLRAKSHSQWLATMRKYQDELNVAKAQKVTASQLNEAKIRLDDAEKLCEALRWQNPVVQGADAPIVKKYKKCLQPVAVARTGISFESSAKTSNLVREFFVNSGTGYLDAEDDCVMFFTPFFVVTYASKTSQLKVLRYRDVKVLRNASVVRFRVVNPYDLLDDSDTITAKDKKSTVEKAEKYVEDVKSYVGALAQPPFKQIVEAYLDNPHEGIDATGENVPMAAKQSSTATSTTVNPAPKPRAATTSPKTANPQRVAVTTQPQSENPAFELSQEEQRMVIEARRQKEKRENEERLEKERLSKQAKLEFSGENPLEQVGGSNVITNNLFNFTYKQVADTPSVAKYELVFTDDVGSVISNVQAVDKQVGAQTKVSFNLTSGDFDPKKQYFLLIRDAEKRTDALLGKIPYKIKISFADEFGF